jgi:uncharacterized protein (TIGR02099 family)
MEALAWAGFFAFAAAVLAVRYWVLPDVERYREDIVAAMSRAVGLPVRVGAIQASWLGLRPQIDLRDVRIYDAQGREALVLPSIENVVGWRSLVRGRLALHSVAIEGPRLTVRRDSAGEIYVAGLKVTGAKDADAGGFGAWLLAQSEIEIRDAEVEWRDELRGAPPLAFSGLEMRVVNAGDTHALGFRARVPPELGSTLEARMMVRGEELRPQALSARVFLQLGYTDLTAWRAWIDYPFNVRQGQGALRVWATLEKGGLAEASADVALVGLRASLADELAPLELASVQGRLHGRALPDGLELSGRGLALVMERGPEMPRTDFQIVWRPQGGGAVAASAVDLEAVRHLVDALPLPPQLSHALAELAPRGRLADSRLEWSGPFDAPTRLDARVRFAEFALRPGDAAPGFAGLSGSVEATLERGKLVLASRKALLELPQVFPRPQLELDTLAGQLEWQREPGGGFSVRIASLTFANAHASGEVYGSYTRRDAGPGVIDLSGVLNRADGRHLERYLPHAAIMSEAARGWLARAILAGQASDVRLRLRGDLARFPFTDPASGQFQVTARVEKGVLDYAAGWPRIENIAGELNFERDRVEITGRSGSIFGAQLSGVRVVIPSLRGAERHVQVSGQAEGPSAEFLKFLHASPLRETAGAFTEGMGAAGRGRLRLKLDIPLAAPAKTRVGGDYEFAANQVRVVSWLPPVEDASGRLAFTESSLTLHDVRGRLLGGPIAISGGTRAARVVEVLARGEASAEAAGASLPVLRDQPLGKQFAGRFGYFVTVRGQDGAARVTFESPLRGLESRLPAPLAKSAADALPLRIEVTPSARGERDRVSVTLGAVARAEVQRRRQGGEMVASRTGVWLGPQREAPVRLPERQGILLYGSAAAFDLDRWLALAPGEGDGQPLTADLNFGVLEAFGRRLTAVSLRASAEAGAWSARVNSAELAGSLAYRARPQPRVVARLSRLSIAAEPPPAQPKPAARPSEFPDLDVVAEEFTFHGKPLGRVELVASRAGEDWRIDRAAMTNPDASFTGRGRWSAAALRTAVEFDLKAADAGGFLARAGQPGLVKGGKAHLYGSLAWRGGPTLVDFDSLSGEVKMQAENGQFLEIEPGLGKLIGLMSLQALPRRIALDFRDVFSKGFQFDRIVSHGQIDGGVIRVREFRMRGPAAEVEMSGEADLAHETQDLRVRVVPSLGDSAAVGIGIVNPVAGVAAAIAQRILKNPLGQIFAYDYSVTGSWAEPKVAKILPPPLPPQDSASQGQ